jgi:hypothetical protein
MVFQFLFIHRSKIEVIHWVISLNLKILPTEGTNVQTHAANPGPRYLLFKVAAVIDTTPDIEPRLTRFIGIKRTAGQGLRRTDIDTSSAVTASIRKRLAGLQGCVR